MTVASLETAAVFIAVWNLCSVFAEYGLLSQVYRLVPQLAVKEGEDDSGTWQKLCLIIYNIYIYIYNKYI